MALPPSAEASPRGLLAQGGRAQPTAEAGTRRTRAQTPVRPITPRSRYRTATAGPGRPDRARPASPHRGRQQPQPAPHGALHGTEEDTDRSRQPAALPGALHGAKGQPATHLPAPPPLPHAGPGQPFKLPCPARPRRRAPARARHRRPRKRSRPRPAPPPLPMWRPRGAAPGALARQRAGTPAGGHPAWGTPGLLRLLPSPLGRPCSSVGCAGCQCRVWLPVWRPAVRLR